MLRLYQYPNSGNTRIVRIVLAEKGLSFEPVRVDIMKGEQNRPEFRRLNPLGKVPGLVDGGVVIYESSVINEYLEERFPAPPLLPADPAGRARVRLLVHYFETVFAPNVGGLILETLLKPPAQRDAAKLRVAHETLHGHLAFLEGAIGEQAFLAEAFSLADASYLPAMSSLPKCDVELSSYPRLAGWLVRAQARSSFAASAS